MTKESKVKTRNIIYLMIAAAVLEFLSFYSFRRIDEIVYYNLPNYGLMFDNEWAAFYVINSYVLQGMFLVVIAFTFFSIIFFRLHAKNKSKLLRSLSMLPLIIGIGINVASFYILNGLNYFIQNDLYSYGLQFSYIWASLYWTFYGLVITLTACGSLALLATFLIILTRSGYRFKPRPLTIAAILFSAIGAAALWVSVSLNESILAFIGLGLVFWGIIFFYIRTEEYVKKAMIKAITVSQQTAIRQLLKEQQCKGKPVYLPPKYFTKGEIVKTYISKRSDGKIPNPELTQTEEENFLISNPPGILLSPIGEELCKLFEKSLKTDFIRADLQYLQQNLPKVFIEDLEIAQNFEMQIEYEKISIKVMNSISDLFFDPKTKPKEPDLTLEISPLSSSLGIALAKTTGRPIEINRSKIDKGKNILLEYRILSEEAHKE